MVADNEVIGLSRVHIYYSKCAWLRRYVPILLLNILYMNTINRSFSRCSDGPLRERILSATQSTVLFHQHQVVPSDYLN